MPSPPSFCCLEGQVTLISHTMPYDLQHLFLSDTKGTVEFTRFVRSYNTSFAFTTFAIDCRILTQYSLKESFSTSTIVTELYCLPSFSNPDGIRNIKC